MLISLVINRVSLMLMGVMKVVWCFFLVNMKIVNISLVVSNVLMKIFWMMEVLGESVVWMLKLVGNRVWIIVDVEIVFLSCFIRSYVVWVGFMVLMSIIVSVIVGLNSLFEMWKKI